VRFLRLVLSNLRRRTLRTALTVLCILVAFLLYGLLSIIQEAFDAGVNMAGADRLLVRHRVSFMMLLPVTYGERIKAIPGVDAVVHWTWFNGVYKDDPRNFFGTFPVEPDAFYDMHPEFVVSDADKAAWSANRMGAIVGSALAERMEWKRGDRVPLKSPIWRKAGDEAWEFDIVGIYEPSKPGIDPTSFFFRYDYFDEARTDDVKGRVGWYMVRVEDAERASEVASAIDAEFANSPYETKSESEAAFAAGIIEQVGSISTILISILSAVFFTILLVAGNTMAQSVRERTEEIGVLKAIGFTNTRVLMLVLVESCAIALIGGAAGVGAAWLITVPGSPMPQFLPVFYLPSKAVVIGAALALGLGVAAGIMPALGAMRLQVAVALRRHQ